MSDDLAIVDPFEVEFKDLSSKQRARIILVLRWFIRSLRSILDSPDTKRMIRLIPEMNHLKPCDSCAFVPTIDSLPQFPGTIYGMLKVILEPNRIFVCHSNQLEWNEGKVDPARVIFCKGYKSLVMLSPHLVVLSARRAKEVIDHIAKR